MPKKYGVKEKDLVVTYVANLILTGKLRSVRQGRRDDGFTAAERQAATEDEDR